MAEPSPAATDVSSTGPEEQHPFTVNVPRVIGLLSGELYTGPGAMLRELMSNCADALEKMRILDKQERDKNHLGDTQELEIEVIPGSIEYTFDKYEKKNKNDDEAEFVGKVTETRQTLTIRDTGVGMTKDELIKNLSSIASSGTVEFAEKLAKKHADAHDMATMIGKFGVGFYSAFAVADEITVYTKSNLDDAHLWKSIGRTGYTLRECEDKGRGTSITLILKSDHGYLAEEKWLRETIGKYSSFLPFPIKLFVTKEVDVTDSDEEDEEDKDKAKDADDDDKPKIEEVDDEDDSDDEDKKKKTKKVTKTEWVRLDAKPIWLEPKGSIKKEDATEFYRRVWSTAYDEPIAWKHVKVDSPPIGGLLFVPERVPTNLFDNAPKKVNEIRIYSKRVFVVDDCREAIPEWLGFVKGVIDAEDLPLNVSREAVKNLEKVMRPIRKTLVKQCIDMFQKLADDSDDEVYFKFYHNNYDRLLKLGIHTGDGLDADRRQKVLNLLRWYSTFSPDKLVSLRDYVESMVENQKYIYYITGASREAVEESPFLEVLRQRNIPVLYMIDGMDEYLVQRVTEYEFEENGEKKSYKLMSVSKENLELPEPSEEEKKKNEELKSQFEGVCTKVKEILGDKVEKVLVSTRMHASPCGLVTSEFGWSANMERLQRAQVLRDTSMSVYMKAKKILEINPKNPIIIELKNQLDTDGSDQTIKDLIWLMYETALLTSGFVLDKPTAYANRIWSLIKLGLNIDDLGGTEASADGDEPPPLEEVTGDVTEDMEALEEVD